jgi:hypothetical protein
MSNRVNDSPGEWRMKMKENKRLVRLSRTRVDIRL